MSTGKSPELLKKDFCIIGQVRQSGNKDKLAFSGLCKQIDDGLCKGYTEHEVINGVLNAISTASGISGYLNTVQDLSLVQLRSILHTWLNEKSSSELYQNFSVMYQLPDETPQEFLVGALSCREKIILCSQEDKSSLKYDSRLIQSLFLRTVKAGLRDESIRIKLRTFLRDENISDEKLLLELNTAACEEAERQAKFTPRNRFHPKFPVFKLLVQNFPTKVKRKENKKMIWQSLYSYCKQVLNSN